MTIWAGGILLLEPSLSCGIWRDTGNWGVWLDRGTKGALGARAGASQGCCVWVGLISHLAWPLIPRASGGFQGWVGGVLESDVESFPNSCQIRMASIIKGRCFTSHPHLPGSVSLQSSLAEQPLFALGIPDSRTLSLFFSFIDVSLEELQPQNEMTRTI